MNDLGYSLLLDSTKKRQIKILSLLLEAEVPLSVSHLSQTGQASIKTIHRDIQSLLDLFPNSIKLQDGAISINNHGDRLILNNYIYKNIKENPLFSIIESSFHGNYETIDSLSEKFFLAESTLRKHLKVLRSVLKKYNLTLNSSPLELIGNEIDIRYFYFNYFDYKYFDYEEIHHSEFLDNRIYNTIRTITKTDNNILNLDYHKLAKWLFISEKRILQSNFVQLDKKMVEKYSAYSGFSTLKQALEQELLLKKYYLPNDNELIFAYLVSFNTIVYDMKSIFFTNEFFSVTEGFSPLTTQFFQKFNLNFSKNTELKIICNSFLGNLSILSELSDLFQKSDILLHHMVENKYPEILSIWHQILSDNNCFNHNYDVAVSLTTLTVANLNRGKKVAFLISGSAETISYCKFLATKYLPQTINATFLFNQPLDAELIEKMTIDYCVCNFSIVEPLSTCLFFQFSSIFSDIEWRELITFLNDTV